MKSIHKKAKSEKHTDDVDDNDPIVMLLQQHRDAEDLFDRIERSSVATRKDLFLELAEMLTTHMEIEEQIFYPAASIIDQTLIEDSRNEHAQAKQLIQELHVTDARDDQFMSLIGDLKRKISDHIEEEEDDLFPMCQSRMSEDELSDLYHDMEALQEEIKDGFGNRRSDYGRDRGVHIGM